MAGLKAKKTNSSVTCLLKSVENEQRRNDGTELLKIFKEVTKMRPRMWGSSIVSYR